MKKENWINKITLAMIATILQTDLVLSTTQVYLNPDDPNLLPIVQPGNTENLNENNSAVVIPKQWTGAEAFIANNHVTIHGPIHLTGNVTIDPKGFNVRIIGNITVDENASIIPSIKKAEGSLGNIYYHNRPDVYQIKKGTEDITNIVLPESDIIIELVCLLYAGSSTILGELKCNKEEVKVLTSGRGILSLTNHSETFNGSIFTTDMVIVDCQNIDLYPKLIIVETSKYDLKGIDQTIISPQITQWTGFIIDTTETANFLGVDVKEDANLTKLTVEGSVKALKCVIQPSKTVTLNQNTLQTNKLLLENPERDNYASTVIFETKTPVTNSPLDIIASGGDINIFFTGNELINSIGGAAPLG